MGNSSLPMILLIIYFCSFGQLIIEMGPIFLFPNFIDFENKCRVIILFFVVIKKTNCSVSQRYGSNDLGINFIDFFELSLSTD